MKIIKKILCFLKIHSLGKYNLRYFPNEISTKVIYRDCKWCGNTIFIRLTE